MLSNDTLSMLSNDTLSILSKDMLSMLSKDTLSMLSKDTLSMLSKEIPMLFCNRILLMHQKYIQRLKNICIFCNDASFSDCYCDRSTLLLQFQS